MFTNKNGVPCWKFSEWATNEPSSFFSFDSAKKDYVRFHSTLSSLMFEGGIKSGGWFYDMRSVLKKYIFKKRGEWREVYAPNKTFLRKAVYGRIEKIIELKE